MFITKQPHHLYSLLAQIHPYPSHNLPQYFIGSYLRQACVHLFMDHIVLELRQPP